MIFRIMSLASLVLAMGSSTAFGQLEIVHTASVPESVTNYMEALVVPKFPATAGVLNTVRVELSAVQTGNALVESRDAQASTVTLSLTSGVSSSVGGVNVVQVAPLAQVVDMLTGFDGVLDFRGTSGASHTGLSAVDSMSVDLVNGMIDPFVGDGDVVIDVHVVGNSSGSGAGNLSLVFMGSVSVELEVHYLYSPDCNANGIADELDILSGQSSDTNFDSTPDECGGIGVHRCFGTGGNQMGCTACPCGNEAPVGTVGGCLNSATASARIEATGDLSVSLPAGSTSDLRLSLGGAPPNAFCMLTSGDTLAPTNLASPCFGLSSGTQAVAFDGLRCAVMNTRRHGGRGADSNGDVGSTNNPWGGAAGPQVGLAVAGAGFVSGQTRYFQVINRDDPLLVCTRGLNTSQAIEVTFEP